MKHISIFILLSSLLLLPLNSYAYLDPGSGSALLQGILGALATLAVVIKLYWHRLLRMLGLRKDSNDKDEKKDDANKKKQEPEKSGKPE